MLGRGSCSRCMPCAGQGRQSRRVKPGNGCNNEENPWVAFDGCLYCAGEIIRKYTLRVNTAATLVVLVSGLLVCFLSVFHSLLRIAHLTTFSSLLLFIFFFFSLDILLPISHLCFCQLSCLLSFLLCFSFFISCYLSFCLSARLSLFLLSFSVERKDPADLQAVFLHMLNIMVCQTVNFLTMPVRCRGSKQYFMLVVVNFLAVLQRRGVAFIQCML